MTPEILRLLAAMAMIESVNGSERYNIAEEAYGLYHCRAGALKDVNDRYALNLTLRGIRNDDAAAAFVVLAYGRMYGASVPEEYARIWNGGPTGMSKRGTMDYWTRVKNLMEALR